MGNLVHSKENGYFALCLIFSLFVYFFLIISLIGIVYMLIGIVFTLFMHGIVMGYIRSNGVKLSPQQFPQVYGQVRELCARMQIDRVPDVFVLQSDGMLNAFATRFFGRNFVILYSNLFELVDSGDNEELSFVIAHELAHIQRNHITKNMLLLPAMWMPFLGKAYSRSCEYTCDRIAAAYMQNPKASLNGLVMLAIGRVLFRQVNLDDYLAESRKETGFFVWFSHVTSTHPPLPKRIEEIQRFTGVTTDFYAPYTMDMK